MTSATDAIASIEQADVEDFDSEQAYREWIDGKLAEVEQDLQAQDARDDALSAKIETVREVAEDAQERATRAERLQAWGGVGYDVRLGTVVETLVRRAEAGRMGDGRASIATTTQSLSDEQGNRFERPGVVDLFDGAISERTCRRYVSDLSACAGLSTVDPERGGWEGGSEPRRLRIDLSAFIDAYGEDWDVEDLLADLRGDRDD